MNGFAADSDSIKPAPQVPWNKVSGDEQKVLTPLAKDWNQLTGTQQRRLITSAKQYSKLTPIQQERFQERLSEWAALTPQQRADAREKFQNLSKLPPAKQHELREKWSDSKSEKKPPAGTSSERLELETKGLTPRLRNGRRAPSTWQRHAVRSHPGRRARRDCTACSRQR